MSGSLLSELKRRNVLRVAAAYIVVAWVIVQVAITLREGFPETPLWIVQALIVLLALGVVPVLVFSWFYELTPEGFKRDEDVEADHSQADIIGRRLIYVTVGAVFVGLALWAIGRDPELPDGPEPGISPDATAEQGEAIAPVVEPDPNSVAVLPFLNMSENPENEYFSDGLTESLLHMLAQVEELRVPARTTVFSFKGQAKDVREIAAEIGVAHVLEGSAQFAGGRVRVTAQLIRAVDGYHAWSGRFDRTLDDIFFIQDEIASNVAVALVASLLNPVDAIREGGADTRQFTAYDFYLRALSEFRNGSYESLVVAEQHLLKALQEDPLFLDAKVFLAEVVLTQGDTGMIGFDVAMTRILTLLDEVLAERPQHPRGRAMKITMDTVNALSRGEFAATRDAEPELRRYIARHPDDVAVRVWLAQYLRFAGGRAEAAQVLQEATRIDPLNPDLYSKLAVAHRFLRQWAPARDALLRALEIQPESAGTWFSLGRIYSELGEPAAAVDGWLESMALDSQDHELPLSVATLLYQIGLPDQAREFHDRVADMAPDSEALLSLDILEALAVGDIDRVLALAREAFARPVERGHARNHAWPVLLYTAIARDQATQALEFIDDHVPGFLDLQNVEVPGYVAAMRAGAYDLLLATRSRQDVLAYVDRVTAHYESVNARAEEYPLVKLDNLVVQGRIPAAIEWALDEVFSQPPTYSQFRFWRLHLGRRFLEPVMSDPRVRAALESWEQQEAEMRREVADYLAERR